MAWPRGQYQIRIRRRNFDLAEKPQRYLLDILIEFMYLMHFICVSFANKIVNADII